MMNIFDGINIIDDFPSYTYYKRTIGILRIVKADTKADSIRVLSREDAREHGEETVQLLEGHSYDFELAQACDAVRVQANKTVRPNAIQPRIGRVETGVETGLMYLTLEDSLTQRTVARGSVEVVSTKINYRKDYRGMLEFIAGECREMLFDVRASSRMRVAPKFKTAPTNLQGQLEFLAAELTSRTFTAAVQRVTSMPHRKLETQWDEQPISRLRGGGRDLARQISCARKHVSASHIGAVAETMRSMDVLEPSLPRSILIKRQVDSLDTPENRFVKYVLVYFRDFLRRTLDSLKLVPTEDRQRLVRNIKHLEQQLNVALGAEMFITVGKANLLPLGSPVLQRKGGYREILLAWLKFDLATQLVWKGGEEVYGAGKRDMATLYEYWLFFQLLRLFQDKFDLATPPARSLFEHTEGGLNLRLRVNEPLGFEGCCLRHGRKLCVRLHYNLTHERSASRAQPGSWSRRMRPDLLARLETNSWVPGKTSRNARCGGFCGRCARMA